MQSVLPDPFLCCFLSAMVQRSVRTWHHIQKEIFLLWIQSATPPVGGKHPLWEFKVPARLAFRENFRSSTFQATSSSPSFRLLTDVGEQIHAGDSSLRGGEVALHLAARWLKLSFLVHRDRLCTEMTHSWLLPEDKTWNDNSINLQQVGLFFFFRVSKLQILLHG